jgi:hypothetical protein
MQEAKGMTVIEIWQVDSMEFRKLFTKMDVPDLCHMQYTVSGVSSFCEYWAVAFFNKFHQMLGRWENGETFIMRSFVICTLHQVY